MKKPLLIVFVLVASLFSCTRMIDPPIVTNGFPLEVGTILQNKCATSGCHNEKSFQNAANLNLTNWNTLFQGSVNGAVAVPYSSSFSSLMQFINTYPEYGVGASPIMPINAAPLSKQEVLVIKQWIENGCPNAEGIIPFQEEAISGPKIYISNQGCDVVSVIDSKTGLVMRKVRVGNDPNQIELPHNIKVSPDGKYWYVCYANGSYLQKYSTETDKLVSEVNITQGAWNVLQLSPNGMHAYVSDLASTGRIAKVNIQTMKLESMVQASGVLTFPHGLAYTKTGDTLYATSQYGNSIYRLIPSVPSLSQLSIQKGVPPTSTPKLLDPHSIIFSPDYSKYFVTCLSSNELRVLDAKTDTLIRIIPVGIYPEEVAIHPTKELLFVGCAEDPNPNFPSFKGSVYVIDLRSLSIVHIIREKIFQPHGIALDTKRDILYVASRNVSADGPAPHHVSECGGRNGFYHAIDINTFKARKLVHELSVDPYTIGVKE